MGNLVLVARNDLPDMQLNTIAQTLFDLNKTEQGRAILSRMKISRFETASSTTLDSARKFLDDYKRLFGNLPEIDGAKP